MLAMIGSVYNCSMKVYKKKNSESDNYLSTNGVLHVPLKFSILKFWKLVLKCSYFLFLFIYFIFIHPANICEHLNKIIHLHKMESKFKIRDLERHWNIRTLARCSFSKLQSIYNIPNFLKIVYITLLMVLRKAILCDLLSWKLWITFWLSEHII